ncbi:hypothetical protein ES703_83869 [subsurface metagenome]
MSPRRWGINTRLWAYRFLCLRDSEQCARCFNIPTTQNDTLDIDHVDGDDWNNDPDNLQLLCRSCNVVKENKRRAGGAPPSDQYVCEREGKEGKASTRVSKDIVNYKEGSTEMQANFLFEVDFRKWLLGKIREQGGYPKLDAIASGAEVVGCSPSTTARYLTKLTSKQGPLQEEKDMLRDIILTLKDHLKPEATILVDLDRWQAKQGQRESAHHGQYSLEPETEG